MVRQRARRVEHFNQPLKRHILVAVGRKIAPSHPTNQLAKARIAGRVRAQHQRVDEKPHKLVQRAVRATRDRAADRYVAPRPKPRQQRRKSRLQHHEQARPLPTRKPHQRCMQPRTQPQLNPLPAIARNRRPRTVKRQLDLLGKPSQPLSPEQQRARKRTLRIPLLAQKRTLPKRVIRILHSQRQKLRRAPRTPRRIALREVARQWRKRPTVRRNVMQYKQKHMLARPKRKQMPTQRRITLQIKRNSRRGRQRSAKLPFAHRTHRKPNPRPPRSRNHLPRHPFPLRKHRAQALVPRNIGPQRCFHRRYIHLSAQPYRQRDRVVRSTPLKPLQKPQPTLRIRQRHVRRTRNRTQPRSPNSTLAQPTRKHSYRRRLKQAADRNLDIKARPDAADQARRKQRVTAQRKKVILNPNPRHPQNLRKQRTQNLLLRRARQATAPMIRRRRQRSAVQLPVRRQRKTIKLNNCTRNHVIRQPQANMRAQRIRIHLTTRRRYHIADKLPPTRPIRARNNRRLRDTPLPKQRRLDLPRLNPKTAHLHLLVRATHKLQHPVKPPARQVPAAVHPPTRPAKPIRNKALRSQPTTTQIPPTNTTTRDVKLPNNPSRHRLQTIVQNINPRVPDRTTNRRHTGAGQCLTHARADRRLRRSIGIDHPTPSRPARHHLRGTGFARDDHGRQRHIFRQLAQQHRRQSGVRDILLTDQPRQSIAAALPGRHHQRRTRSQRNRNLRHRRIKARRGKLKDTRLRRDRKALDLRGCKRADAAMLDRHTFGYSGGAGGIDDVGEVVRRKPRRRRARRLRRNRRRLGIEIDDPRAVARQPSTQRRGGDQERRAGILQHERQTLDRVARVERQIGPARLENANEPHQQRRRALEAQPHHRLRTNPLRAQMLRQPIGPCLQLPVAQPRVRKHNCNRIRRLARLRRKQLRQRRRHYRTSRRVPVLQQQPTLSPRQQLKPTNRNIRIANCSQKAQESLLVVCKIRRGIKYRIGIKVDSKPSTFRAIINSDRQVLDRSKREITCESIISGKTETVIKPHDVDVKPEQPLTIADLAIPPQVCNLVTLVPQYSTHLPGDLA